MSQTVCPICERPCKDATICVYCAEGLDERLAQADEVLAELDITETRQSRMTASVGSRSAEIPLPYNTKAGDIRKALVSSLSAWARVCLKESGQDYPETHTAAQILSASVEWLRHHPAAEDAYRELTFVLIASWRIVDRPPIRRFLGPCAAHRENGPPCPYELYCKPGDLTAKCQVCATQYDVSVREAWAVSVALDHCATATNVADYLSSLGRTIKADLIRKWAERGRIVAHSRDANDHPLYRVGDVFDLWLESQERTKKGAA